MLSYQQDLTSAEQKKLTALMAEKCMENGEKVVLLINEEFEIVDKTMFDKMNKEVFEFKEEAGEIVSDIQYCALLKMYSDCATLIFSDNTVYHVEVHLAICIYNGEFEQIILDM